MHPKRWLRKHEHAPGVRQALGAAQAAYTLVRRVASEDARPALAGGWPERLVPFPAPRPIMRFERAELRRAARAQSTSFFDGEAVKTFERLLAERFRCKHALALSSGTAALHTALMAAGVGPGDEVIVPALTYVATAQAVMHAGATPRFVDAEAATWNLDPTGLEAAIGPRTKAILPVHVCGVACDMETIGALARTHGLVVIEDAAHAHGSVWRGRPLGTVGDLGCFSFGSPKSLTTGEGGALLTDDDELARRARMAMNLGECTPEGIPTLELAYFRPEQRLDYRMVGWNYRMSTFQAAMGIGQLRRFDAIRAARARNGAWLRERLADVPGLGVQAVPADADPCYYTFPIEVRAEAPLERSDVLRGLERERIDFRLWSNVPLAEYAIFDRDGAGPPAASAFPVARRLCTRGLGLRVDPSIGPSELRSTVRALRRLLAWGERPS